MTEGEGLVAETGGAQRPEHGRVGGKTAGHSRLSFVVLTFGVVVLALYVALPLPSDAPLRIVPPEPGSRLAVDETVRLQGASAVEPSSSSNTASAQSGSVVAQPTPLNLEPALAEEQRSTSPAKALPSIGADWVASLPARSAGNPPERSAYPSLQDEQTEPSEETPPLRLPIAGQVLDDEGLPVPWVEVVARSITLFHPQDAAAKPFEGDLRTFSDFTGFYFLPELPDGEYRLSTVATDEYPAAQLAVRAGEQSANLVLSVARREQRVHGVVWTANGEPLEGVRVAAMLSGASAVQTDPAGRYALDVTVRRDASSYVLRYQLEGYRERRVTVGRGANQPETLVWRNVVMEPQALSAPVRGILMSADGAPVAGELIRLYSRRLNRSYQDVSDSSGKFSMPQVELGDDYRLWVNPKRRYQDYSEDNLWVSADGVELDVVLQRVETGRLTGRMADLHGNPIPHFTLSLRSTSALWQPLEVSGDRQGQFAIDSAPQGDLVFLTRSTPALNVKGVRVVPGEEANVSLVLDWGPYEVHGQVLDPFGMPLIPPPQLGLSWSYRDNEIQSLSTRRTTADADGHFSFSRLGPGHHTVTVRAPGFEPRRLNVDPSVIADGLLVQLEEAAQ